MSALRNWLDRLQLPQAVVRFLRATRKCVLWSLEPLDWIHRRVAGQSERGPVPPLWLRKHSGPIWAFDRAAGEMAATIAVLELLKDDHCVLDVGCGCGSMAVEFQRMLGPRGKYLGFDVHEPSIQWCTKRFAGDERFRFELARLRTPWTRGGAPAAEYGFPMGDAEADFVLSKSVFTHMLERESQHYLAEIRRVLRNGGSAIVTAFLLENGGAIQQFAHRAEMTFPFGGPSVWWQVKSHPEAAVAYEQSRFIELVEAAGLAVRKMIRGQWSGYGVAPNFQDILIVSPLPNHGTSRAHMQRANP